MRWGKGCLCASHLGVTFIARNIWSVQLTLTYRPTCSSSSGRLIVTLKLTRKQKVDRYITAFA